MFKKAVLMMAVVLSAAVMTGKAQMFAGGSLGLDLTSNKMKADGTSSDGGKTFGFTLSPKFGYYLNDRIAIGGQIGFGISQSKNGGTPNGSLSNLTLEELMELMGSGSESGGYEEEPEGEGGDTKTATTTFSIAAFGRYHLFDTDRLSLIMEGALGFTTKKTKTTMGKTTSEGDPTKTVGLSVMPVLAYNLTEKLSLEASSDFLRFGFSRSATGDSDFKDISTSFGFGANSPVGAIQLGMVYKF